MNSTSHQLPLATARQTLALLRNCVRGHGLLLSSAIMLSLVAAASGLVAPCIVGHLIDKITAGATNSNMLSWVGPLLAAMLIGGVTAGAGAATVARLGQHILAGLREQALERTLQLPGERIEQAGIGDVISRISDDVAVIGRTLGPLLGPLVSAVLAIVLTLGGLIGLHPVLALAGLCALPVYYFALLWYLPRATPRFAQERQLFAVRAETVIAALRGTDTVDAYQAQEHFAAQIDDSSNTARLSSRGILWFRTSWSKWLNWAEYTGLAMILLTGYFLVDFNFATVGAVTTAALLFHRLFNPMSMVVNSLNDIQSAAASLTRIAGLANMPDQVAPVQSLPSAVVRPGQVQIRNLDFDRQHTRVLHDINLDIQPGEQVALVGPSGAGKSTLALLIAGLLVPESGQVLVGDDATGGSTQATSVGLVTQETHIFTGSLTENLTLACPDATEAQLWEAVTAVAAQPWVVELPANLDTLVGDGAHQLSAVQAAQIALARAYLANPQVLILDEAGAESIVRSSGVLDQAITQVLRGRTGIIVAHRLNQVLSADRIIVMDEGRIVESGTHDELLAVQGQYQRLWNAWSSIPESPLFSTTRAQREPKQQG
ncbi:MAG: ABC transporter ATP-binding protein [Yaniella sp.]|uniref:ABC transporter ATP-binding protein n=1 Tax=Yaniella sp. TaxID=2773929 RepID=UPI003F969F1B